MWEVLLTPLLHRESDESPSLLREKVAATLPPAVTEEESRSQRRALAKGSIQALALLAAFFAVSYEWFGKPSPPAMLAGITPVLLIFYRQWKAARPRLAERHHTRPPN